MLMFLSLKILKILRNIGINNVINWTDFSFSAINLWSLPKQYRDYQEYRRTCVLSSKQKQHDVSTNKKIIELVKDR